MPISTAQDYINQVRRNVHDTTSADFSDAALLGMVNEGRQRVALDTHCYRQFLTGLNTIARQETYYYNSALGGISLSAGGAHYINPEITFTGGAGTGATAAAVTSGGVIEQINMTNWGTGYSTASPPIVTITDVGGSGTGAVATPNILYNVLDVLSISVIWGSLRTSFGWLPFSAFQAYCRAYANQYSTPGVFTLHPGLQKIFMYPIPDQVYPMELDVVTQPTPLQSVTDPETQIALPWNDAVQYFASHLAIASLQQYEKSLFWKGLYDERVKKLPATAFHRRMPNTYRTYWPMVRKL